MRTAGRCPPASRPAPMPVLRQRRRRLVGTPAGAYHPLHKQTTRPRAEPGRTGRDGGRAGERGRERRGRPPGTAPVRDLLRRPDVSPPESADEGPPGRDRPRPHRAPRRARHRSVLPRPVFGGSALPGHRAHRLTARGREPQGKGLRRRLSLVHGRAPAGSSAGLQLHGRRAAAGGEGRAGVRGSDGPAVAHGAARGGRRSYPRRPRGGQRHEGSRLVARVPVAHGAARRRRRPGPLPPPRGGAHHGRRGAEPRHPPRPAERGRGARRRRTAPLHERDGAPLPGVGRRDRDRRRDGLPRRARRDGGAGPWPEQRRRRDPLSGRKALPFVRGHLRAPTS